MTAARDLNPFRFSGPLPPEQMIDRDPEADDLLALAEGGHSFRLVGPRRYGKTTLLRRILEAAEQQGTATVLVDLQDVLSIAEIVVRIERGYERLKGPVRRHVENLLRAGTSACPLAAAGSRRRSSATRNVDAESVLLRLLELPTALFDREGTASLIVFDEIQDVLPCRGPTARSAVSSSIRARPPPTPSPARPRASCSSCSRTRGGRCSTRRSRRHLAPLPLADVGDYVARRFRQTGRDAGTALAPFLEFTRGHPQRSMMLAHYLWARTPRGRTADEGTWVAALDQAAADGAPLMRAIWHALTVNERRVARALALVSTPLHSQETATAVGIKRSSIGKALESLIANADAIDEGGNPRLTDPMFELWLRPAA